MSLSPAKPSTPGESRDSLTEKLRNSDLAHQLSTEDFTRIFFIDALTHDVCTKCIPENAQKLARTIRKCEEKAAYDPICELLNGICYNYAVEHDIDEDDALWFVEHADYPPCHHPRSYTDKVATQKPDIVLLKKWLALLLARDVKLWTALDPKVRSKLNKLSDFVSCACLM
ncbi:hypothetical protein AURDEDRAFT_163027 [Auricularia subglabra TFB-10046 SS5]|nr:hypothetical protein AURDEDRAFT_163027 [Auricularia subglabra TFB-10046 SS5]